ncbi:thiol-disulfide oxidoreductase DCC family protein [Bacillus sp. BRMEA1]|nr:thiol-disulfide oxidoreductase DCC family protein [Neobacillus endophyticus]NRD79528.1 thiol-disulfide oxidoreductase DCC family protein [Neobacillus endophyticus]
MEQIILFDGECHLCNSSVQFIIKRDRKGYFKFASLQGKTAQNLIKKYKMDIAVDSFVLIKNKKVYYKSTAALLVSRQLNSFWKLFSIFLFVPPMLRDLVYEIIAHNRYRWFGKTESCMLPKPEWKNRFLD